MQWIQNGQSSGSCVFDVLFLKWPTRTNTQRDRHSLLRIRFLCIRSKLEYFKVGLKFRTSHCDKDETNRNGNATVRDDTLSCGFLKCRRPTNSSESNTERVEDKMKLSQRKGLNCIHFNSSPSGTKDRLCLFIACGRKCYAYCNIYRFNFVERIPFSICSAFNPCILINLIKPFKTLRILLLMFRMICFSFFSLWSVVIIC